MVGNVAGPLLEHTSSAADDAGNPPEDAVATDAAAPAGGVTGAAWLAAGCDSGPVVASAGAALTGPSEGPIKGADVAGSATSSVLTGAGAGMGAAAALMVAGRATLAAAAAGALAGGGAAEAGGAAADAP